MIDYSPSIQSIILPNSDNISCDVLRLDLIHPEISGNKWFKLSHHLQDGLSQGFDTFLTFGGAYSNHIAATAAACEVYGIKCIGIIGGEESYKTNHTLKLAAEQGMQLHFVTRDEYKKKTSPEFISQLKHRFGNTYIVPEGGASVLGAKGCEAILQPITQSYDYYFVACGTATTFAGLCNSHPKNSCVVGISVLKGENRLIETANSLYQKELATPWNNDLINYNTIIDGYHFGGYAKHTENLLTFKQQFEQQHSIPLDYVYTSKLFYAVSDLISNKKLLSNSKLLVIHTGGLQGNNGYENRYSL